MHPAIENQSQDLLLPLVQNKLLIPCTWECGAAYLPSRRMAPKAKRLPDLICSFDIPHMRSCLVSVPSLYGLSKEHFCHPPFNKSVQPISLRLVHSRPTVC